MIQACISTGAEQLMGLLWMQPDLVLVVTAQHAIDHIGGGTRRDQIALQFGMGVHGMDGPWPGRLDSKTVTKPEINLHHTR